VQELLRAVTRPLPFGLPGDREIIDLQATITHVTVLVIYSGSPPERPRGCRALRGLVPAPLRASSTARHRSDFRREWGLEAITERDERSRNL
jgi:hypothetical protein